jgi:hypothetical protein
VPGGFSEYGKDIWGALPYSILCGVSDGDRGGTGIYWKFKIGDYLFASVITIIFFFIYHGFQ